MQNPKPEKIGKLCPSTQEPWRWLHNLAQRVQRVPSPQPRYVMSFPIGRISVMAFSPRLPLASRCCLSSLTPLFFFCCSTSVALLFLPSSPQHYFCEIWVCRIVTKIIWTSSFSQSWIGNITALFDCGRDTNNIKTRFHCLKTIAAHCRFMLSLLLDLSCHYHRSFHQLHFHHDGYPRLQIVQRFRELVGLQSSSQTHIYPPFRYHPRGSSI